MCRDSFRGGLRQQANAPSFRTGPNQPSSQPAARCGSGRGAHWLSAVLARGNRKFPKLPDVTYLQISGSDDSSNTHQNKTPTTNLNSSHTTHHHPHTLSLSLSIQSIVNMGFTDLVSDAGLTMLNNWLVTRSYITGYVMCQCVCFQAST